MGRPASPWLQRAYEVLADGKWHSRDQVIAEMMKVVPRDMAYRRGVTMSRIPAGVSKAELVERGARHVSQCSLNAAGYITTDRRNAEWLVRRVNGGRRVLFEVVGRQDATHALIPISEFGAVRRQLGDVEFVRRP